MAMLNNRRVYDSDKNCSFLYTGGDKKGTIPSINGPFHNMVHVASHIPSGNLVHGELENGPFYRFR